MDVSTNLKTSLICESIKHFKCLLHKLMFLSSRSVPDTLHIIYIKKQLTITLQLSKNANEQDKENLQKHMHITQHI